MFRKCSDYLPLFFVNSFTSMAAILIVIIIFQPELNCVSFVLWKFFITLVNYVRIKI